MTESLDELPIIFRAERAGDFAGEITAVFPTLPGTNDPATFTIYAHVGQHGSGGRDWYAGTRPATESEAAPLLAELRSIYETRPASNPETYGPPSVDSCALPWRSLFVPLAVGLNLILTVARYTRIIKR